MKRTYKYWFLAAFFICGVYVVVPHKAVSYTDIG